MSSGRIIQIIGAVIDVEFERTNKPFSNSSASGS